MRGIRRTFGTARVKKAPAIAAKVRSMVALAPDSLTGLRDRALLLIGFAGAFRRPELVALDVADIEETEIGPLVTIRHSKSDQEGSGDIIAISRGDVACPVKGPMGMAAGRRYRGWRYLSADRQGQQVALRAAYGSVGCQYRQGICVARRFGRNRVFRSFAPMGFLTSAAANVDCQDDGRITAQVRRHAPRLCP
jgi:hypothetical protein